ncbi:Afadin- and alpha-actinin-binding protein, partial [Araneus ventricosus]
MQQVNPDADVIMLLAKADESEGLCNLQCSRKSYQMNQPRSIYKTDYVPFDWMENNFSSESNDFCSSENIDECLRHISQELSALGYPSIYSSSSDCEYAVNCDIVRLLNVTFELIGSCRDHVQIKDDLECSNRRLSSDLHVLSKKNAQLKESLEQFENKYKSVLEKERQLKEKNNRLLQTIKNEKEESKRLSSQIQQQKVAYQHEIRKYENNINQMKARLNQIISDRNPDKKVASISPSNLLQRNSKQRGKWKTGSVAKSCVEEMYSSVISSYENRCQEMMKEICEYRSCLEQIQHQIVETDLSLGEDSQHLVNFIPLSAIWNGTDLRKALEGRFQYLLNKLKETALKIAAESSEKSEDGSTLLKLQLSPQEKLSGGSKACEQLPISEV